MSFDYISESKILIGLIRQEGHGEFANQMQDMVDGAATGTELVMGLRFYLSKALELNISELTKKRISTAIAGLSDLLR